MEAGNLGNYSNSRITMVVGENGATKSAKDGNKSRGKEQMDRNVPITLEPPTLVRGWSQMGINGQNSGDFTSGMAIVKANEFNYDFQLIISDAKCRSSSNGPLLIVGCKEMGTIPMMENLDVLKNGPAVGPVNQAH